MKHAKVTIRRHGQGLYRIESMTDIDSVTLADLTFIVGNCMSQEQVKTLCAMPGIEVTVLAPELI